MVRLMVHQTQTIKETIRWIIRPMDHLMVRLMVWTLSVPVPAVLHGLELDSEHCVFENQGGMVTLVPLGTAQCSVNGVQVTAPSQLNQGEGGGASEPALLPAEKNRLRLFSSNWLKSGL